MAQPAVTTFEYDDRGRRVRASGASDIIYIWGDRNLDAVVVDGDVRRYRSDETGRLHRSRRHGGAVGRALRDVPAERHRRRGDHHRRRHDRRRRRSTTAGSRGDRSRSPTHGAAGPSQGARWHEYYGVEADGLVWLGSRPYDPATRQFLATDPQSPAPGKAGGASPYTYAANDPINLFDPSGNSPISIDGVQRHARPQDRSAVAEHRRRSRSPSSPSSATMATAGASGPVATILIGTAIGAASGAASGAAREGLEPGSTSATASSTARRSSGTRSRAPQAARSGAGVGVGFSAVARGASVTMPG